MQPILSEQAKSFADAAVLTSGGVESSVLIGLLARAGYRVHPLYVRFGLRWEEAELAHIELYLRTLANGNVRPLTLLELPMSDVYSGHWSVGGSEVPGSDTPDEAVYLPGRNLLLSAKASVWCALNGVHVLCFGSLSANPFSDATRQFFTAMRDSAAAALSHDLHLERPFEQMHKDQVISLGADLPLHLSLSCLQPRKNQNWNALPYLHCGRCNKCAERQSAFARCGLQDAAFCTKTHATAEA